MNMIQTTPFESGGRPPIQSWGGLTPPANYSLVPDTLDTTTFYAHNGFVTLTIEGDTVTAMEPNLPAWEAWKASLPTAPQLTPAQKREQAYNTEAIIPWQGEDITVTAAAGKWEYYAAEGDMATADTLTVLIAAAKDEIRKEYPDI